MRLRYIIILTTIIMLISAAVGISKKQSYTNVAASSNPMEYFNVGVFTDGLIDIVSDPDYAKEVKETSKYILKIKAISDIQIEFREATQVARVEEVRKGNGISEGERIKLLLGALFFELEDEVDTNGWAMNANFRHVMKAGEEYVVYLMDEKELEDYEYRVFCFVDMAVNPIFDCKEGESIPTLEMGYDTSQTSLNYEKLKDNEYFVQSREGLKCLLQYKHDMLHD